MTAAFLASRPALAAALKVNHPILSDMSAKLARYGSLSDKQIAFALSLAQRATAPKLAVPTGKATIVGRVVSVKERRSDYTGEVGLKLTVRVERDGASFLAWGTCPRALHNVCPGDTVEVAGTFKPGNDPGFCIVSRPVGRLLASVGAGDAHEGPMGVTAGEATLVDGAPF